MKCEYFRELISAGLDGELKKDEKLALAEHLKECGDCKAFAAELKEIEFLSRDRKPAAMPKNLERKILKHTVLRKTERWSIPAVFRGYYRIPRGLVWAGVLALLMLAGDAFLKPFKPESVTPVVRIEQLDSKASVQKVVFTEDDIVSVRTVTKRDGGL